MDDYSLTSLSESKNEWCSRLVDTLTPAIIDGLKSIYAESLKLCIESDEEEKYLMTFQTFLSRIPQWNENIIQTERERIEKSSNCSYLEELITCVHIIQLKALTCVRVGQKQKKIDIDIPSKDTFIHRIYINSARKIYTNIYLFEKDIEPLQIQKNSRELELIIKECILSSIRDTMPIDKILLAYIEETNEDEVIIEEKIINQEVIVEDKEQDKPEDKKETNKNKDRDENKVIKSEETVKVEETPKTPLSTPDTPKNITQETNVTDSSNVQSLTTTQLPVTPVPEIKPPPPIVPLSAPETSNINNVINNTNNNTINDTINDNIKFSNTDTTVDSDGKESSISAPKDIKHLEDLQRRRQEEEEEDDDDEKLQIGDNISLEISDVNDLSKPLKLETAPVLEDIEILEPL
tara:strand:+ start:3710 stop:4930 length:1221 start_codon:yes stop_codon:yes gene_type:complete